MYNRLPQELIDSLTTRDLLAIERTKLANERTFLAYIRTSLSILIASVGLIQFFSSTFFIFLGFVLLPVSFIFLIIGIKRYVDSIKSVEKQINENMNL